MSQKKTNQDSTSKSSNFSRYKGRTHTKEVNNKTKGTEHTPSGSNTTPSDQKNNTVNYNKGSNKSNCGQNKAQTMDQMDLDRFTDLLKKIAPYCKSSFKSLTHDISASVITVVDILNLSENHDRVILLNLAKKIFKIECLETESKAGTVCSKIFGCQIPIACQNIDMGCTPTCAGAVKGDKNTTGYTPCSHPVLSFDGAGNFESYTNGSGGDKTKAFLYVPPSFTGFKQNEINYLKNSNIQHVRLISYDSESGKCHQASPTFNLVENYKIKEVNTPSSPNLNQNLNVISNASATLNAKIFGNSLWLFILLGLLLVVLFVFGYFWMKKKDSPADDENYMNEESNKPSPSYQELAKNVFTGMTPRFPFKSMTVSS